MFSEYILGQYLTLISDVISWVEEEHEIMSDKGFFKQFMSEKQSSFQKLKKLLILIVPTSIYVERYTGFVSDWSILNNDWATQKFDLLTLIWGSLCCNQILNPYIARLIYKRVKLMAKGVFSVLICSTWKLWKYNSFEVTITRFEV